MRAELIASSQISLAVRLRLEGRVQGVGYRPFVVRLARARHISGSVQNLRGDVEIIAEGDEQALEAFATDLIRRAPQLAAPRIALREALAPEGRRDFVILQSAVCDSANVFVPPDAFMCADCLNELVDPRDPRYQYPFINCTQCGPRYTLIDALPYDRANTTMAGFALCEHCAAEYSKLGDRRFHAEPVACPVCGPQITLEQHERVPVTTTREALSQAVELFARGSIVAVKGIGGYHLMCDAQAPSVVETLRARKHRPGKPFAVLFPTRGADGLDAVREHVELDAAAEHSLLSTARPIVLAQRRPDSTLAPEIAPGLAEIGVLIAYSPLHHLLVERFGGPLVATSGNVSGEPVLFDNDAAQLCLHKVADAFLHHDRRIARPADDSVVRVVRRRARVLRLGRGLAPCEMVLPFPVSEPVLAVGGHMKVAIALAWDRRAVLFPHIADMGSASSERVFEQVVADVQRLHGVNATAVVCDKHPNYATTRWARQSGLRVLPIQHHRAHASALAGEHNAGRDVLVFTWDGVGLGDDGTLWGGEAFIGGPGHWNRVASLRPFRLPGGERASRAPWRCAAALCWEADLDWPANPAPPLAREAWVHGVNAPQSSAVGRLFDAVAAIVLGIHDTTYEGQGPMMLEACATEASPEESLPMDRDHDGVLRLDWAPLMASSLDARVAVGARAARLHAVLAKTIAAVALELRGRYTFDSVGLTGGVFQNRRLTELAADELERTGFDVWLSERIPCNDGGLAFGQLVEASASTRFRAEPA